MSKPKLLQVPIGKVKPNPKNPRTINDDKFKKLVKSIKEFPEMLQIRPIVVNKDYMSLGGNQRLKACKEAGLKMVWICDVSHLTDAQQKEFIIKDNLSYGAWDWEAIHADWDTKKLEDWGMDVEEAENEEAEEDDFVIPDKIKTDIKIGDVFDIGEHRLICGDSTSSDTYKALFGQEMADMVVTDPPYNVDYTGKTKDALKIDNDKKTDEDFYSFLLKFYTALASFTKPGGAWYVWHADLEGANFRRAMVIGGIMLKQCLIWAKSSMVMGRQDYHWQHEPCLYGWKEGAAHKWYGDRKQTTVLNFDRPNRNADHPTMKPIPLIAYQITNSSKKGDIVADGFLGSGTTMVACQQLKRKCYGVELDSRYCQVIIDRMSNSTPGIVIKKNGKPYNPSK